MNTQGIGGEVITYIRFIEWLHKHTDYDVFLSDFPDGASYKYVDNYNLNYIKKIPLNVNPNDKFSVCDTAFPNGSIVFTNACFLVMDTVIKHIKGRKLNFLFYSVEPHTFSDMIKNASIFKKLAIYNKIKKRIKIANQKNSLVFQDYPNFINAKKYYNNLQCRYLPIPIIVDTSILERTVSKNKINFCYIGRNCLTKNNGLVFLAKNLNLYAQQHNDIIINFQIISGMSEDSHIYKKIMERFPKIKTFLIGNLYGKELDYFLIKNSDVVLGMGVSCLEAAKLGIPAISVPARNKELPLKTKCGFVCDFTEYSLGGYYGEDNKLSKDSSFADLVDYFRANAKELSERHKLFADKYFNIDKSAMQLVKYIENAHFSKGDM